jgi:hypothetical protein
MQQPDPDGLRERYTMEINELEKTYEKELRATEEKYEKLAQEYLRRQYEKACRSGTEFARQEAKGQFLEALRKGKTIGYASKEYAKAHRHYFKARNNKRMVVLHLIGHILKDNGAKKLRREFLSNGLRWVHPNLKTCKQIFPDF